MQETGVPILPGDAEPGTVHLAAGEQVELGCRRVQVGDGAAAELAEREVGIGKGHALFARAVGEVGEMIHREVVVTRVGVGVVAAGGLELVEVYRAHLLGMHRGLGQREAERPVAHVAEVCR